MSVTNCGVDTEKTFILARHGLTHKENTRTIEPLLKIPNGKREGSINKL